MSDNDERLGAYLDGELSPEEMEQLEAELQESEKLRDQLDFLRGMKAAVFGSFERPATPALLRKRLERALEKEGDEFQSQRIEAYVDGQLESSQSEWLEQRMDRSIELQRRIAFMQKFKELLAKSAMEQRVPEATRARIEQQLEALADGRDYSWVERYVDGDLDEEELKLFETALEASPEMASMVAFQELFKRAVEDSQELVEAPQEVVDRVLQALAEAPTPERLTATDYHQVEAYVDGQLEAGPLTTLRQKLDSCEETRRRIDFQTKLKTMVGEVGRQEKTPDLLRRRLLRELEQVQPERPQQTSNLKRPMLAAASVLLVSMLTFSSLFGKKATTEPMALALANDHFTCTSVAPYQPGVDPVQVAQQGFGSTPELAQLPARLQIHDVRVCPLPDDQRVLHLIYKDSEQPKVLVSLFGLPREEAGTLTGDEQGLEKARMLRAKNGLQLAAWNHKGWTYSLAGEVPSQQLRRYLDQSSYPSLQQAFRYWPAI